MGGKVRDGGKAEQLDPQLWHACAGAMVRMPQVGSLVVYFPQGHAEHAASPPEFPPSIPISCTVLCRVLAVKFLADAETDEVFARIRLQPDLSNTHDPHFTSPSISPLPEKSTSFAKTLTQSDANNGGGFSVPRYCAETIFPRLDYSQDPPVQIVLAKDVHGTVWKFRHIYRGTPRRHLLTTGWSNFVNQKKLVAGDAIVFLRNAAGELCVGVRRSTRGTVCGVNTSSLWHLTPAEASLHAPSTWKLKQPENSFQFVSAESGSSSTRSMQPSFSDMVGTSNFARNRARVTAKDVLEAASLAASGHQFDVVYYPRATISEFCLEAHSVRASLQQNWAAGMRFKMAVETEDASRISWFMGTVSKVQEADPVGWPKSPWKVLQVTWDEPEMLQGIGRVSPWQVELVSPMQLPLFSLPKKKARFSQTSEFQFDGAGISMAALASNLLGHTNPWHGLADKNSAGMQGARHDRSYMITPPEFGISSDMQQSSLPDGRHCFQEHVVTSGPKVSTELNMGSLVNRDHPNGYSHLHTLLTVGMASSEPALSNNSVNGDNGGRSTSKGAPFLLFGKAIDMSQSINRHSLPLSSNGDAKDGLGHGTSDGKGEVLPNKLHMFFSSPTEKANVVPYQEQPLGSSFNEVGTLDWFKEQAKALEREKSTSVTESTYGTSNESMEATEAVNVSFSGSYEERHKNLLRTFGIQKAEMVNRVVFVDSRPIENEPYG